MSKRGKRVATDIGVFLKLYRRKAYKGCDPNDRTYDRNIERLIKKMKPEDLDKLMHE
jgi:hypothetical protein